MIALDLEKADLGLFYECFEVVEGVAVVHAKIEVEELLYEAVEKLQKQEDALVVVLLHHLLWAYVAEALIHVLFLRTAAAWYYWELHFYVLQCPLPWWKQVQDL
mgnify:CR=1 FL=1